MTIKDVKPQTYDYKSYSRGSIIDQAVVDAGQTYKRIVKEVLQKTDDLCSFAIMCGSCGNDVEYHLEPNTPDRGDVSSLEAGDVLPSNRFYTDAANTILCLQCHTLVDAMISAEHANQKATSWVYDVTGSVKGIAAHIRPNHGRHSVITGRGGATTNHDPDKWW